MNEEKKINLSKRRITLIGSIVVALFFVLLILGKPFLLPFPSRVEFDAPVGACFGDDASVVVDHAGERLLFLDGECKLKRVVTLGDNAEINNILCLVDDGNHFYFAGYKLGKNSDFVSSFRVVRMDHDGRNPATVLDFANEDGLETNYILSITAYDGCVYVARDDYALGDVIVTEYQIESGKTEDILTTQIPADYSAKYDPKAEVLYVNDYYGRTFLVSAEQPEPVQILADDMVENYLPMEDGGLLWLDSINKNLYKNDQLLLEDTNAYYSLYPCKEGIVFDSESDSRLSIYNFDTGTVNSIYGVDFSLSYLLFSVVGTVSMLYLGVLLVILIFRAIRHMYRAKNYVNVKRAGIAAVLIASACIISVMYTNKIIDNETRNIKDEIRLYSHYFVESFDPRLLDNTVYTPAVGNDPEAWDNYLLACDELEEKFGFFRGRMDDNRKNGYLSIFKKQGDKLITVFESTSVSHIGYQTHYSDFAPLIESEEVERYLKLGYNFYHSMLPITDDDGEIVGVLEYGQDYRLSNEDIKTTIIDMIVKLLSVFATIYIILIELIEFFKDRRKRKELILQGTHPHPEISMIRTAMFLYIATDFVDSIVAVYVAKQLLQVGGIPETSFLLALPALMMGIGIATTCFAFNLIAPRVYVKRIAMIAGITYFIVRMATCVAILLSSFVLYCLMKLLAELALAYLYCIIQTMRVKANTEEERYYSSRQFSLGRLSGAMLGALISGFVFKDISQSVILYVISAAIIIPLILLLKQILPQNTIYVAPSEKQDTISFGKKLSFLFDKSILIFFAFVMIPMYMIIGYQGYMFPLYADAVQMSAIYVTTAVVMSRALLTMLADSVESLLKRINPWKTVIFSMALIGIAFMEFAINSSIIWAMLMLVIAGTAEAIIMPAAEVLWTRRAKAVGMPLESITANMALIAEIFCALKETMLSVFLLLGNNAACIALGAFCLGAIVIFMLFTRKKSMASAA